MFFFRTAPKIPKPLNNDNKKRKNAKNNFYRHLSSQKDHLNGTELKKKTCCFAKNYTRKLYLTITSVRRNASSKQNTHTHEHTSTT